MGACWRPQILVGHGKRTLCFFLNLAGITSVWLHITTFHHLTILRNYRKPIFMYLCMMLRCLWLFSLFMQTCKFSYAAWFWVIRLYRKVRLLGCLGVSWIFSELQCVFSNSKSNQCWTGLKNRPAQEARVCGLRHSTRIANKWHNRACIIWHPYFLDGTLSERCH